MKDEDVDDQEVVERWLCCGCGSALPLRGVDGDNQARGDNQVIKRGKGK